MTIFHVILAICVIALGFGILVGIGTMLGGQSIESVLEEIEDDKEQRGYQPRKPPPRSP